jgi:hypothetical protein
VKESIDRACFVCAQLTVSRAASEDVPAVVVGARVRVVAVVCASSLLTVAASCLVQRQVSAPSSLSILRCDDAHVVILPPAQARGTVELASGATQTDVEAPRPVASSAVDVTSRVDEWCRVMEELGSGGALPADLVREVQTAMQVCERARVILSQPTCPPRLATPPLVISSPLRAAHRRCSALRLLGRRSLALAVTRCHGWQRRWLGCWQ